MATRSHRLQLRAVEDVPTSNLKFEFGYFSLTDFSPASTILKVIVLRVALCNMRKKSNISECRFSESGQSHTFKVEQS